MNCRSCENKLTHVFADLHASPASNSFLSIDQLNQEEAYYPLKVFVCEKCFLVQMDEYKKTEAIFDNDYVYFSSYSKSWVEHARQYTEKMIKDFGFDSKSLVVELASNDGYLLQHFVQANIPCLGVEPTENTAEVARKKGVPTISKFFGVDTARMLKEEEKSADLILGNNVLAHVPDIHDFIGGLSVLLKQEGIATFEFPYLVNLIDENQFDTIYHEHFSYLSITALNNILPKHDLEVFKVEKLSTHGGSLRMYLKRKSSDRLVDISVSEIIESEKNLGLDKIDYYRGFQEKCFQVKVDFLSFLLEKKKEGKKVAAYGAAAKGNTLLNYAGVKKDLIDFVVDASPYKQGKFLPGSLIPVLGIEHLKKERPDVIIILAWNLETEILSVLKEVCDFPYDSYLFIPKAKKLN